MTRGVPANVTREEFARWVSDMEDRGYRPERVLGLRRNGLLQMLSGRTNVTAATWLHCQHLTALLAAKNRVEELEQALSKLGMKSPPAPDILVARLGDEEQGFVRDALVEARQIEQQISCRPEGDNVRRLVSNATRNLGRAKSMSKDHQPGSRALYAAGIRSLRVAKRLLAEEQAKSA